MNIGITLMLVAFFSQAKITGESKLYKVTDGNISFFSSTPVEDIEAVATNFNSLVNPANRQVAFIIPIKNFDFPNKTMQEHFNENYMESDKFQNATFTGTINENVDLLKPGTHDVTVTGKLNIHGVEQTRTIPGKVEIKGDKLSINSKFEVKLVDHNIKVPSIVVKNIAEIISVTIKSNYVLK